MLFWVKHLLDSHWQPPPLPQPLDRNSSKAKACITENLKIALQLLSSPKVFSLRFDLSSPLILAYCSFAVSLILPCTCVYMFILSSLSGGNIVNDRRFVFYFTIPQSIVYHVLNKKHSINVWFAGKQEGKLRFQEGDCNITQNHIKESQ